MKFSLKLLLATIVVMAAAFGFSGFYFVNYVFETSLSREVGQALDESSILSFAFETAALNLPMKYNVLQNSTVEEVASNLETGGQGAGRLIRISDEQKAVLYASDGFDTDNGLLEQTDETTKTYRIISLNEHYYVHTGVTVNALDRVLYLETMRDISEVFTERALGFSVYRRVTIVMLIVGTVIMHLISAVLTKPIRILTGATKRMAEGDYSYRAKQVSMDELGQLTEDFNHMAGALEENIERLEEEIQAREDFVAAFAHELKTPLTSIIGYADMLRSRKLDEEKSLMSANYIYTEGKRLEAMSFRLLDIMVTKRSRVEFGRVSVGSMFAYLKEMFGTDADMEFVYIFEDAIILAEGNLIKTVLVNLIDNACKASEAGSRIEVSGERIRQGYRFSVRDYGVGIPEEEQRKITKAFYMADKSRARSKNGAGLGLALCVEILRLHKSELKIESVPKEGSCISFILPEGEEEDHEE
ncbi:MAG: HAMP domain-containing histidine kinase [Lachnospiraceae bacterium]|nr:HAMP domain-containing histidine kinase [Lachnospiraceae bacterium]MDD7027709.1 HAMP domain-containing sensor histidine kinase [Lachnospiraceae bacterium]